jgi:hypothetical protein
MATPENHSTLMNSALFIDFDNIYITLEQLDKQAAEKFATSPDRWLDWLEKQLPVLYPGTSFDNRRILIRRCYLNPTSFSQYRPHFIRAACEVIDCPPLTARGKTSTDIHLVMDTLEALSHKTHFHEFILFSGDADFTPLLLNIRKHARFSAVLSIGYASPAYKASCDQQINPNVFIESALDIQYQEDERGMAEVKDVARAPESLLLKIVERVSEVTIDQPVAANDLPAIYKQFPEFTQSNHWLGFFSLRRLTEAIVNLRDDLVILDDEDSWSVAQRVITSWPEFKDESDFVVQTPVAAQELKEQIAEFIKELVQTSPKPIVLSALAHNVKKGVSGQGLRSDWLGAGSFKGLLKQLDLGNLMLSSEVPGHIYDPLRHEYPSKMDKEAATPQPEKRDLFLERYPDVAPLAQKIHKLTDMPYLLPEHYAILFREIARELNTRNYQLTRTSRTVRDQCLERGAPIARSHVNFVLTGLTYIGYPLDSLETNSAQELGEKMVENTVNLCKAAQFDLSQEEVESVRWWLLSQIGKTNGNDL